MTPMPVPRRARRLSLAGSRGSSGSGQTSTRFPERRDNPPPPVRRVHCATPGSGSRVRSPAPAAAESAAGWHPKASWPCDDDSCCRPPADPARRASRLSPADRCRARIARQPAAAHRRAGQQQIIDWLSSGTALAKPNWPTTGVPSGRPVQMPIRYRALRPTAHASR